MQGSTATARHRAQRKRITLEQGGGGGRGLFVKAPNGVWGKSPENICLLDGSKIDLKRTFAT